MRDSTSTSSFLDSLINTVAALIFPLALSLLFPVMLYGLVLEKEEKLVQMMKMNGMKISSYWFIYALFNFMLAFVTNVVFFLLGALVLDTTFFTKTSPALLVTVALGWIFSQIGLAAFLQTLLDKARSANIVGYIFAIWTMMIGSTLSIGVYQIPNEFPGWLQALPPMAFNRLFYLMLINCSDATCFTSFDMITDEMKNCIAALYVGAVVLFLLGAYLLEVLPQEFGVRRHPLFPITGLWRWITCQKRITYSKPGRDAEQKRYLADGEEDPLSEKEREEISKMDSSGDYPLVINNLRKLYVKQGHKGPYAAVKSFNLRVGEKETFGLLGPNGAGKTTLINMLTGMINPDYGNAWIGGYDIISKVSKAQLEMGVCPQFDLLWPQLTV
jgi:ABC-type multidrug transport system fused ATPase/permease subunit